ncbi:MAG TPA: hypothetical protein VKV40_21275 [Ktedonobacteraceae bacterium]|nr:hypothetical protein [Ktedonobacteraceae bacterium]
MMTRIKQWLHKLISWLRWREDTAPANVPVEHASRGSGVDPMMRSSLDGSPPRQGVAPQMGSQGEPRRSTLENWRTPDPLSHPYSPVPDENWDPQLPFSAPQMEPEKEPPLPPPAAENFFSSRPVSPVPPAPLPAPPLPPKQKLEPGPEVEQHLEFLRYLVLRGVLNEGFPEDQTPEQYRKNRK